MTEDSIAIKYSRLGYVIDELARKRDIRGPAKIAKYVRMKTGDGPNPSAWYQVLVGETKQPLSKNIELFAEAFELDEEERVRLALVYAYPESA